ncbi:MAG: bifunctional 3-phenylpropionate/cinnamic acid dioxygenase ferredoxin subunit [Actinomycetota bacterium]|nr:bifunctional 3-phenylpropionate/cinnamic acid dioxygenase ferredoxin subunit [Actinomycetota bacterium]
MSVRACSLSELPEEGALRVELAGKPVCIARSGGEVFAIGDRCSHADVSLSEGDVEDGKIECWLHGSMFDLRTGQPTGLPANRPVPTYPVTVEGDDVLVQMEQQ